MIAAERLRHSQQLYTNYLCLLQLFSQIVQNNKLCIFNYLLGIIFLSLVKLLLNLC